MTERVLYTIGHSNHDLPVFVGLLRQRGVTAVADVRSSPFSAYNPQFNRETLSEFLRTATGISYVFLGRELGARREEPECYDERGQVMFDAVAETPLFRAGLERLRAGAQEHHVALMCAEKDPLTCHRTILVCRELLLGDSGGEPPIGIQHIREDGTIESHAAAESRLLKLCKLPERDLFRSREELLEEAYQQQARRVAWIEKEPAEATL